MPGFSHRKRLREILAQARICTVATASKDGAPEAAVMVCAAASDSDLYFYTFNDSRKYSNLQNNPRASIAIFDPPEYVQLDGEVQELSDENITRARDALSAQSDEGLAYQTDPRCRYFRFSSTRVALRVKAHYPSEYVIWQESKTG